MNLEDVDRELDTLGATPASPPIERVADLAAVDALLATLGQGASQAAPARTGQTKATPVAAAKPAPAKPAAAKPAPAKPAAPPKPAPPKPPAPSAMARARPSAQRSAMPPPPPKSIVPRVAMPGATRQVVAPDSPKPGATRQVITPDSSKPDATHQVVVTPSPSSPGTLSADDLFAGLADDDAPSEHPNVGERVGESDTSETATDMTGRPLSELFSVLDDEVAEVGNLFEEEPPPEEPLSLELGDFDDLAPSTGTSVIPSSPPPRPSAQLASPAAGPSRPPAASTTSASSPPHRGSDNVDKPVADSMSLFSAADVAAIRRASSVPAPMPPSTRSVPPPPTSSALAQLMLEDDFELLIDDDESDAPDSTFVSKADDFEETNQLDAPSSDDDDSDDDDSNDDDSNDEEPDPSGKKDRFFKKLFG